MIQAFRSEWVKLRRRSLVLPTYLGLTAVSALFTVLVFSRAGGHNGRGENFITLQQLAMADGLARGLTRAAPLLGVVAFGIAAAQVAFEFSLGTLRQILVRQPRRSVLLSGKALGILTFLAGAVICSGLAGGAASMIMAHVRGIPTTAWTSPAGLADLGRALGNVALATVGFSVLGILAGILFRSPAPAAIVGFIYLIPVELLLSGVVNHADRWLPGQLLTAVAQGAPGDATFTHALVVSAAYAAAAVAISWTLFAKRDVTA